MYGIDSGNGYVYGEDPEIEKFDVIYKNENGNDESCEHN